MPYTVYNIEALIGGGARTLDGYAIASLVDGDRAHGMVSGEFVFFKFDVAATDAENVAVHPYKVRPNDYSVAGVWIEQIQTMLLINNLKPVVNGDVNKLDIFTKSGGAVPDANNVITVAIPDGNGNTFRSRAAAYLSGTSQFIMAAAANYWSKGSLDAEIKTAYVYAIWDGTGIVWALGGYSGFTRVPASTTATDDDFFLLEADSTYTKVVTDYCVCVGKIRYQYDTADAPDHTIQATVLDAPQVMWNPKSDYGYIKHFATTITQGSNITEGSIVSLIVKQSKKYKINWCVTGFGDAANARVFGKIRTGSATYASAALVAQGAVFSDYNITEGTLFLTVIIYLNVGDTIHGGVGVTAASGNRLVYGDSTSGKATLLTFAAVD